MTEENKNSILSSNEILDIAFENCCRCSLNPDNSPTRKLLMSLLSHRWGTWDLEVVCPKVRVVHYIATLGFRHNFFAKTMFSTVASFRF